MKKLLSILLAMTLIVTTSPTLALPFKYNEPITYHVYIGPSFFDSFPQSNSDLSYVQSILASADSNDTVCMNINSPGGYVVTFKALASAMLRTQGTTVAVVKRMAYSAGGYTAIIADQVQWEGGEVLLHIARTFDNNGNPILAPLSDPDNRYVLDILMLFGNGKVSSHEIDLIKLGKDVILKNKNWPNRVYNRC